MFFIISLWIHFGTGIAFASFLITPSYYTQERFLDFKASRRMRQHIVYTRPRSLSSTRASAALMRAYPDQARAISEAVRRAIGS
jgi:hypothetical protein